MVVLEMLKNIVTIIATSVAAIVAILGLKTWKKQLKGKTEYDLSRRLLISVYKIRNAISLVRQPFKSAGEIAMALKESGIAESNFLDKNGNVDILRVDQRLIDKAVYISRWKVVDDAQTALDIEFLEAEAVWGKNINDAFSGFYSCKRELYIAIRLLIEIEKRDEQTMATISCHMSDHEDVYGQKLSAEINRIEGYLKTYLH